MEKIRGSKYTNANTRGVYKRVMSLLDEGKKVLFVGLPCAVAALYGFLAGRPDNLYTCELICHDPTSREVHTEYLTYLEKKFKSKIVDFSVRYKNKCWGTAFLYAKFANGKEFLKKFYDTEYGYAFSVYGNESCYACKFKGNDRQGDIMVGDFWGASKKDPFWNSKGTSVIFAETEKGNELLKSLKNIKLFPTTFERATEKNTMVFESNPRHENYDKFKKNFQKKGLMYAARKTKGIKGYIIGFSKKLFPRKLKSAIRKCIS